jgi:hypothetical protein
MLLSFAPAGLVAVDDGRGLHRRRDSRFRGGEGGGHSALDLAVEKVKLCPPGSASRDPHV